MGFCKSGPFGWTCLHRRSRKTRSTTLAAMHAFLSYCRENAKVVAKLREDLALPANRSGGIRKFCRARIGGWPSARP